jgi:hypothetical protein
MAAVRRAHRLGEADEILDLLRIAALHGITTGELDILFMRFARATVLAAELRDTNDAAARDRAAEELVALWSVSALRPRLPRYSPAGATDLDAARLRLLEEAAGSLRYERLTDALRTRIGRICRLHAQGNGTVSAVLEGAANALDLDIGPIVGSVDRFWHAAPVHDRLELAPFDVAEELIGLEENPRWRNTTDSTARTHGELWSLIRRGFERALPQIRITGVENGRTIGPMVVNRDEGRGVGYTGSVPRGKILVFTEEGRALLDGADVTSSAYAWEGACFAASDSRPGADFVFDGQTRPPSRRPATFVTTTPPNALDREAVYPHADVTLPMPGVGIGVTRFAFFVQEAHFNALEGAPPAVRLVTPRTRAAFAGASVFAAGANESPNPAAEVALSWIERRAFTARLLIPARFRALAPDDPEGTEVLRRVALGIERFRPVGVELKIEFIDDRWTLGSGVLTAGVGAGIIEQLRSAMVLWEGPP